MEQILTAISSVGFPIVCAGAMGWYVYRTNQQHHDEITAINDKHYQEMAAVTEAINNNTVALTKLAERLAREE